VSGPWRVSPSGWSFVSRVVPIEADCRQRIPLNLVLWIGQGHPLPDDPAWEGREATPGMTTWREAIKPGEAESAGIDREIA
jgi:hypothetical protein